MKYKYKYKNRPLRLLKDKNNLPYIKYKNKNISLKGYNIDEIIKIIKKLTKQTKKKKLEPQEQKKKKEQIKSFLTDAVASSSSVVEGKPVPIVSGSIKEDTEKIKELSNEIQIYKSKVLNSSNSNIDKKIKKISNNLKAIENIKNSKQKFKDLVDYDPNTDTYSIDFGENFDPIKGNSPEDLKNEMIKIFEKLKKDKENLLNEQNKFIEDKKKLDQMIIDQNFKQQELNDKILEQEQQQQQLNIQNKLLGTEKLKTERELDLKTKDLKLKTLEAKLSPSNYLVDTIINDYGININDLYKSINRIQPSSKKKTDLTKKEIAKYIDDNNLINIEELKKIEKQKQPEKIETKNIKKDKPKKKQPEIIEEQIPEDDQEGEGQSKLKGGLWTNQINKIMNSSKYYIDTIANNELDDILNYIYNNNILKGCFIMNTLNSYDHSVGHWIAIYYDVSNDGEYTLEYYDPFGNDPENNKLISKFKKLFEKMGIDAYVKVKINKIKQQSITSSNCGWFSIKFLLERLNGISFKDATKYKKISNNEQDITEIKKHYNKYGFI